MKCSWCDKEVETTSPVPATDDRLCADCAAALMKELAAALPKTVAAVRAARYRRVPPDDHRRKVMEACAARPESEDKIEWDEFGRPWIIVLLEDREIGFCGNLVIDSMYGYCWEESDADKVAAKASGDRSGKVPASC